MFNFLKKVSKNPLHTESLIFKYKDRKILDDLNVDIKKAKIVAIIGKSGSGKSTFLKLITGVMTKKFKGLIRILGKPRMFSKKDIGYVPQEFSLIPDLTIEENIRFFGKINGLDGETALKKGKELLETLHITENIHNLPTELSGGQKVRLNVISSLLHNPSVVIADEPFVGLDFLNRRLLWNFFNSLKKKGKTIILTSHLLSEIEKYADHILVLSKGKIIMKGNPKEIKEKLKTNKIIEFKFNRKLTKDQQLDLKEYDRKHAANLIDLYEDIALFSVDDDKQKKSLTSFLSRNKMRYQITNYKEPNLDEAFMRVE